MTQRQFRVSHQHFGNDSSPSAGVEHPGVSMEFSRSQMQQTQSCSASMGLEGSNDNWLLPGLTPTADRYPGTTLGDDDNATHESRASFALTCDQADDSREQWIVDGRHQMFTEDQDWPTYESRHDGERLTAAEVAVQRNHTTPTDDGSETTAMRFGVQMLGDLQGHAIQEGFHEWTNNGATGKGLQGNNVPGSSIHPVVGAGYQRNFDLGEGIEGYGGARGKLALGPGHSWSEGFAGFEAEWDNGWVDPFVGGEVRAGISASPDWADVNDNLTGPYLGGGFTFGAEFLDTVRLAYTHEYGGPHGDAQGVISLSGPNLLQNELNMNK